MSGLRRRSFLIPGDCLLISRAVQSSPINRVIPGLLQRTSTTFRFSFDLNLGICWQQSVLHTWTHFQKICSVRGPPSRHNERKPPLPRRAAQNKRRTFLRGVLGCSPCRDYLLRGSFLIPASIFRGTTEQSLNLVDVPPEP